MEVDDAQGFVVLRDGFHVGAPLGVAVEAPIGTDLGLPPIGGFVVLQAMRPPEAANEKDECFTVLCDSCCHLVAEFGHLRIEPGYGLASGRFRFHGLTELPQGVSAVMRVHRGIWKKPLPTTHEEGSAGSDAGRSAGKSDAGRSGGVKSGSAQGGVKSDAGLSGLSSRKSGEEAGGANGDDELPSALHCCVPLVGLNGFEPEITVLGQCWREPPYKEDAPFIRATVVLPEERPAKLMSLLPASKTPHHLAQEQNLEGLARRCQLVLLNLVRKSFCNFCVFFCRCRSCTDSK